MTDPRVLALCQEFGLRLVGKDSPVEAGTTRAQATLRKIVEKQGIDRAREVLVTLADTTNNKASLEAEVFGAVADLLGACQQTYKDEPSKWLEVFDRIPIGELQAMVHDLRGFVPLRPALAGLIYERIWRAFGPRSVQPDLFDERGLA